MEEIRRDKMLDASGNGCNIVVGTGIVVPNVMHDDGHIKVVMEGTGQECFEPSRGNGGLVGTVGVRDSEIVKGIGSAQLEHIPEMAHEWLCGT